MSHAEQLAKYVLFACGPSHDDAHFLTAAGVLAGEGAGELIAQHPRLFSAALTQFAVAACRLCVERSDPPFETLVRLAPMLRRTVPREAWRRNLEPLETVRRRLAESLKMAAAATDETTFAAAWGIDEQRLILKALVLEGLYLDEHRALARFAETLGRMGVFAPLDGCADTFAKALRTGGWFEAIGDAGFERIGLSLQQNALAMNRVGLNYLRFALGYAPGNPEAQIALLGRTVFMPLSARLYDLGRYNLASSILEWDLSMDREGSLGAATAGARFQPSAAAAVRAGSRIGGLLGASAPLSVSARAAEPCLGFVVGGASSPDFLSQVADLVIGLHREKGGYPVTVYGWGFSNSHFKARLAEAGVKTCWAGEAGGYQQNSLQRFHDLRERMIADAIQVAVWCEALDISFFGIGAGVAPVQVLLTEHFVDLDAIGGHATGILISPVSAGFGRNARRVPWVESSRPAKEYADVDDARARVADERDVLIGSHVGSVRGWTDTFIGSVASILRQRPGVIFAWSGAEPNFEAVEKILGREAARRFRSLSLPSDAFARAMDVFLEPPLAEDRAALKAMAAGVPVVAASDSPSPFVTTIRDHQDYPSRESARGGKARKILELAVAADEPSYVAQALGLIDDATSRRALGEALRNVHRGVFEDRDAAIQAFVGHLRDLTQFLAAPKRRGGADTSRSKAGVSH